jgi:hypothetical protein
MSELDEAFERFTSKMSDGGMPEQMPRRTVRFTVPAAACAPGVFKSGLEITLRSLTPEDELRAARGCDADPVKMALAMALMSLYQFQGEDLSGPKREFLWRALDQAGRNLVVKRFGELGTVSPEDEEKSDESVRQG